MTHVPVILLVLALVVLAAVAGTIVWGDAPMPLADDVIIWSN